MAECLKRGIPPESSESPQSIYDALEDFFDISEGKLSNISALKRSALAEQICLVATGKKTAACYTIIDQGEGQNPQKMSTTLLSLGRSNKLRIPFVQGKFNMGGTGVFQFCGKKNLQFILSKRHPRIAKHEHDSTNGLWGFTVVRREDPGKGVRSSTYRYLAPEGKILSFSSESLPLLPDKYPNETGRPLSHGTFIKLYEYQMIGLKTNILFDLYNRLSLLMPAIALPIRFYERRNYSGHSMETTLAGLSVRLEEDKRENLELGFPTSATLSVQGQKMSASIFAFRRGQSEKYKKDEGILFTINGQTHGFIPKAFFTRSSVGMAYLADSLLVILDCSLFDGRSREDLFMNSRDRLRSGDLKSEIERNLEDLIKNHPGLRELRERRKKEEIEEKVKDDKPLEEVINNILKKSPTLSKLFLEGVRISTPFNLTGGDEPKQFKGRRYPSFFTLSQPHDMMHPKNCPVNVRCRVEFETDADNDYFNRDNDPGEFIINIDGQTIDDYSLNLWNGIAHLHIKPGEWYKSGDILHVSTEVIDSQRATPFVSSFFLKLIDPIEKQSGDLGKQKEGPKNERGGDQKSSRVAIPDVSEVYKEKWDFHHFTDESALRVVDDGEGGHDFFINMDNKYLLSEIKGSSTPPEILNNRFKYGMVLIGLAFLHSHKQTKDALGNDPEDEPICDKVGKVTSILAPFLLPMISSLGEIELSDSG